jgi:hypothetical protein
MGDLAVMGGLILLEEQYLCFLRFLQVQEVGVKVVDQGVTDQELEDPTDAYGGHGAPEQIVPRDGEDLAL